MKLVKFLFEGFMSFLLLHERMYRVNYQIQNISQHTIVITRIKSEGYAKFKARLLLRHPEIKVLNAQYKQSLHFKRWEDI